MDNLEKKLNSKKMIKEVENFNNESEGGEQEPLEIIKNFSEQPEAIVELSLEEKIDTALDKQNAQLSFRENNRDQRTLSGFRKWLGVAAVMGGSLLAVGCNAEKPYSPKTEAQISQESEQQTNDLMDALKDITFSFDEKHIYVGEKMPGMSSEKAMPAISLTNKGFILGLKTGHFYKIENEAQDRLQTIASHYAELIKKDPNKSLAFRHAREMRMMDEIIKMQNEKEPTVSGKSLVSEVKGDDLPEDLKNIAEKMTGEDSERN